MKKNVLIIILSLFVCNTYSQIISPKTRNIVNSIIAVDDFRYDDIDEKGGKTSQYYNYDQLLKSASEEELLYFANDPNEIVKGFVYLALMEKQNDTIEAFYLRSIVNSEKVVMKRYGVNTEIFLSEFLRYKLQEKISVDSYIALEDTFYNKLNSSFDSILIMNYKWNESTKTMDKFIRDVANDKKNLSSIKRWLANSYFEHKIAKKDDDYLFGRLCGYPKTMPYLRSVVEKSLKDSTIDRVDYFDKWISCDILVVKVYGAEALIRLHNEGKQISPMHLEIITELKSSFRSVQMCMDYYRERKPVRWALKDYELKDLSAN